jgi:cyclase
MEKTMRIRIVLASILLIFSTYAAAHSETPVAPTNVLQDMMDAVGWSFDDPAQTQELASGFYVLFGVGGNILVSSGDDGVLIVDDQFPEYWGKLGMAMKKQGDRQIDFVVNTHWHFDHADGNKALGKRNNTWIVSQANSRQMMLQDQVVNLVTANIEQPTYPEHALPDITYDDSMQFHFNGERIDLLHPGPAHTTGDTAVIFRGQNAVHMGDVFNNAGYPFIDAGNGGGIDGVIAFCEVVLAEIDEDTIVVPGHGAVASRQDLQSYVHMLKTVRGELVAMIKAGKNLEDVLAAGITTTWDAEKGDSRQFIDRAYTSLTVRYLP